jgi:hypothetical protein
MAPRAPTPSAPSISGRLAVLKYLASWLPVSGGSFTDLSVTDAWRRAVADDEISCAELEQIANYLIRTVSAANWDKGLGIRIGHHRNSQSASAPVSRLITPLIPLCGV